MRKSKTEQPARTGDDRMTSYRWTLFQASREFGVHREQMERRRMSLNIQEGLDGCFSTKQVSQMIFGDKEFELIGKLAAERKQIELRNEVTMGNLIPTATAAKVCEMFLVPVRQIILSSGMTDHEKESALEDLVKLGEIDWGKEARDAS